MNIVARFANDESGATAIEYGLIAALIAVGIIAAATTLGNGHTPLTSLLDLLAVPNTVKDNALVSYFKIEPRPFDGENIVYLRNNAIGDTLRKLFTGATVN